MPIDSTTAKLPLLTGPYENWVFGDVGRIYSGDILATTDTARKNKKDALVAGVIEETRQTSATGLARHFKGSTMPVLWNEAFETPSPSGLDFIPAIFKIPAKNHKRAASAADIHRHLATLHGKLPLKATAVGLNPQYGYRLNAPILQSSFDQDFAAKARRREPRFTADRALLERIRQSDARPAAPLVIMAVIDDGLPFAHPLLRDRAQKSRMEFCWLQAADVAPAKNERTVLFGREHTRHTINNLMDRHGADEDTLYRDAGAIKAGDAAFQPLAGLWSHGAHILDMAAGHDHGAVKPGRTVVDADMDIDRIRLIGVDLPAPLVMDTVGFGKDAMILSAFHYIFERAEHIERAYGVTAIPLVINFSFGFTGGPHDGTDRLEEAIAHLVTTRNRTKPTRLVMPVGNEFVSALHGEISSRDLGRHGRFTVPWRIQPNDRTSSYLEIWYPARSKKAPVPEPAPPRIIAPSGSNLVLAPHVGQSDNLIQKIWYLEDDDRIVGQVSIDSFRGNRWRLLVILAPSEPWPSGAAAAQHGLWRIAVDAACIREKKDIVSCRIQRDNGLQHPASGGRQSYFDHPGDTVFAANGALKQDDDGSAFVRRYDSLNGLVTHGSVIVVGGLVATTGEPAQYSSAGPLVPVAGSTGRVTCAAPSDDSHVQQGQRAAGTRRGSFSRLVGTSAAAPQIARNIALAWIEGQKSPSLPDGTPVKNLTPVPAGPGASLARLGQAVMRS